MRESVTRLRPLLVRAGVASAVLAVLLGIGAAVLFFDRDEPGSSQAVTGLATHTVPVSEFTPAEKQIVGLLPPGTSPAPARGPPTRLRMRSPAWTALKTPTRTPRPTRGSRYITTWTHSPATSKRPPGAWCCRRARAEASRPPQAPGLPARTPTRPAAKSSAAASRTARISRGPATPSYYCPPSTEDPTSAPCTNGGSATGPELQH